MGTNQSSPSNPMLNDWKPHPSQPNVFSQEYTHEQVYRHTVVLEPHHQSIFKKRMSDNYQYVAKVKYYQSAEPNKGNLPHHREVKYHVYTDNVTPLLEPPPAASLQILKGFRRLVTWWGNFRVCPEMIGVNEKNEIKVWINPNIALNSVWKRANSEEEIIVDIANIVRVFHPENAAMIKECFTLNQAINNLLTSRPDTKSSSQMSNRSSNNAEDKGFRLHDNHAERPGNSKNPIRSTKQTEQQNPKIPRYIQKFIGRDLLKFDQKGSPADTQYLQNIPASKSPSYINAFKCGSPEHSDKLQQRKMVDDSINKGKNANYSEFHNQKESSVQFNSSQPGKETSTFMKRKFKPIQIKPQEKKSNPVPNSNAFLSHYLSPKGYQLRKQAQFNAFKDTYPAYTNRKSDLNRQFLQKNRDGGRPSDLFGINKYKTFATEVSEKKQISLSREPPYHEKGSRKPASGEIEQYQPKMDLNRNKTQQFSLYTRGLRDNYHQGIPSPRYQTKQFNEMNTSDFLQEKIEKRVATLKDQSRPKANELYAQNQQGQSFFQTKNSKLKKKISQPYLSQETEPKNAQEPKNKEESTQRNNESTYEEKKVMKQKLAKTIRDELGGIFQIQKKPQQELQKEMSMKDLILQRRVEQKKKNFAELKSQTLKLLNS